MDEDRGLLDTSIDSRSCARLDELAGVVLPFFADQHRVLAFDLVGMGGGRDFIALPCILNVEFLFDQFGLILVSDLHNEGRGWSIERFVWRRETFFGV